MPVRSASDWDLDAPPHSPASARAGCGDVTLTRTVRFSININDAGVAEGAAAALPADEEDEARGGGANTFAGSPAMRGLGRYYELDVRCTGPVDPRTGYSLNIKEIDEIARRQAVPLIAQSARQGSATNVHRLIVQIVDSIGQGLGGLRFPYSRLAVLMRLTPTFSVESGRGAQERCVKVLMRQQFDFAAAHRLHIPALSEEQNRALFGKCNNARGHGHNYRVEPCVEMPVDGNASARFTLADLETLTASAIIDRFDHKHLNEDTEEFNVERGGLNPSVENISKVCFELLAPQIAAHPAGVTLRHITVWETEKTSATYPA